MNLLQTIETNSNFPLVLKIVGIVIFGLSFLASWSHIPGIYKFLMIIGLLMFFVGLRFVKIYTPPVITYGGGTQQSKS